MKSNDKSILGIDIDFESKIPALDGEGIKIKVSSISDLLNYFSSFFKGRRGVIYGGEQGDEISISDKVEEVISNKNGASAYSFTFDKNIYSYGGDDSINVMSLGSVIRPFGRIEGSKIYSGDGDDIVALSSIGYEGLTDGTCDNDGGVIGRSVFSGDARIEYNRVDGGDGRDTIMLSGKGGSGNIEHGNVVVEYNHVYGGEGSDSIVLFGKGGAGIEQNYVAIDHNSVFGDEGSDTIVLSAIAGENGWSSFGRIYHNRVEGDDRNEVEGDDGNDKIILSVVNNGEDSSYLCQNRVSGGSGNDIITLSAHAREKYSELVGNQVYGGDGDDIITLIATSDSGAGVMYDNILYGGDGKDTFSFIQNKEIFHNRECINTIADFSVEEGDLILLSEKGSASNFVTAEQEFESDYRASRYAEAAIDGDIVKYCFTTVGEDGYLFYKIDDLEGGKGAIKLTGVTTFDFSSIDGLAA